ncbi:pseudouridine synthase [Ralstonia solanacearum]|uniref:pseudouridine synthase n=1 Tax=Ralstonia solanacearum TaxID=305 RepID=UPI000F61E58B|nr:pseudouridine synthase [Ralstonia solanacearum]
MTDSDDLPGDDTKRLANDPTQRATRPGKRATLGVRRDDEGNPVRTTGKPLRASDLNRDRQPLRPSQRRPEPQEGAARKPSRPRRDDDGQPPREAKPRRMQGDRPPRRSDDERPPRRYGDDRAPRRFDDEQRPPRRFEDRPARAPRPEREERAPRREEEHTPRPAAQAESSGLVRLSKRMSELGLCSRREADEWIPRGWVLVNGEPVTELGSRVRPDAEIEILPAARSEQGERVTVLLHKPMGYVSGQAEDGYEPAATLFTAENQWEEDPTHKRFAAWQHKGLAPAGRLDIDSTGLLVLTQDGRVARHLIGEDSTVEKEYLVRVVWDAPQGPVEHDISKVFPEELLEKLRHGLSLDGEALKPAKVSWQNEEQLRFVLREGKKRQIRRMCEQVGLTVVGLKRIRMGSVVLGDLPVGKWRFLGRFEKF